MVLTIYLLVLLALLVVEVGFEGQLGAAQEALEAALVVEGEVFERAHLVDLVHRLATPQAGVLVGIHDRGSRWGHSGRVGTSCADVAVLTGTSLRVRGVAEARHRGTRGAAASAFLQSARLSRHIAKPVRRPTDGTVCA
uniref:Putative secreted protein n=1 Tax=Ixodes ricinus TaxID=34613 RepID=A0A6B0UTI5_IXORI